MGQIKSINYGNLIKPIHTIVVLFQFQRQNLRLLNSELVRSLLSTSKFVFELMN